MAKTALTQLQDQIEAIRREAYNAGYAAAMQAIRDFAGRPSATTAPRTPAPAAAPVRAPVVRAPAPAPARVRAVKAAPRVAKPATRGRRRPAAKAASSGRRPQRGTNARLIAEVLKAMPAGSARPAEIRSALQRDKGVQMAFTSIRHALGQLATRKEVEATGDGKTWRYLGAAS
jgi:hypothetical protein